MQAVHAQSCQALCYPVGCSLRSSPSKDSPGQGYWSGLSLRGCSWDQSHLSRASRAGRWILYHWATGNVTCWWLSFSFRFCLPVGLPSPTPPVAWSCLDSLGQVDSCKGAMQEKAITTRGHCNPYAGRTSRTDGPSTSPRRKLIALRFRFSFDSGVTLCGWISVVAVCYVIESMCALLAYCSWKKTTPFKAFPFLTKWWFRITLVAFFPKHKYIQLLSLEPTIQLILRLKYSKWCWGEESRLLGISTKILGSPQPLLISAEGSV